MAGIRVGTDIGGTFTDVVLLGTDSATHFGKTLTTNQDPAVGVLKGLEEVLKETGNSFANIATIIHGTTLVTNAIIERKGVKTALLTTRGFRDQLEIGLENRYDLADLFLERPEPLVPRELRFPVTERVLADGTVLQPLDEKEVRGLGRELHRRGIQAVAVCFLHSYVNSDHEQRVASIIREVVPGVRVSISSDVVPEMREYQRMSTTVANVYVQPIVERYLGNLEDSLCERGFRGSLLIMTSAGGTCTVQTAIKYPIRILESGPVGGALAGCFVGERSNMPSMFVFDMGGTTAKISMVEDGKPFTTHEFEVARAHRFKRGSGLPIKAPVIEMIEIGAGGGSIARIDRMGLLKVGPQSSGSEPGPACYGLGGTQPTVTDADLILGYLDPDYFLGGAMRLDREAASRAIEANVAVPRGLDVLEAAQGIYRIVNDNMASIARIHAVERAKDVRAYPLFALGGAGPVHACAVARILGVSTIVIPKGAGVCSAFGFLTAPLSMDFVRSHYAVFSTLNWHLVNRMLDEMSAEGRAVLAGAGIDPALLQMSRSCDMRYQRQTHEITVSLPDGVLTADQMDPIQSNFVRCYSELYTEAISGVPIETLNWRVRVSGPAPEIQLAIQAVKTTRPRPKGERPVYFSQVGNFQTVPIYDRHEMGPGSTVDGPAIVEERESTTVVEPGFQMNVDAYSNLLITRTG